MTTNPSWRTALAYGEADSVVVRGYDLGELVRNVSFAEAILLLARGERPSRQEAEVLDALFVSVLDHGIVPSSIVSRYLAAAGTPLQVAVAGGVMSFGDIYGGAGEQLARVLAGRAAEIDRGELDEAAAARAIIAEYQAAGARVPGFGHPLHPHGDPRVAILYEIADRNGVTGRFSSLVRTLERELEAVKGRKLLMNHDGAMAALGLDLGLDWRLIRALAFVPRSAGLAVHAVEEMTREKGWRHVPDEDIVYDGPARRPFEEGE